MNDVAKAIAYAKQLIGKPYGWWTSGPVPDRDPAWAQNAPAPKPSEIRTMFCAAIPNVTRRYLGLEIPHVGNLEWGGGQSGCS